MRSLQIVRWTATAAVVAAGVGTAGGIAWWTREPLLVVDHAPPYFERRAGALSANACGRAHPWASLRYRLDEGPWTDVVQEGPRAPKPQWTIELLPEQLRQGANVLEVEASAPGRIPELARLAFVYDPSPLALPREVDWSGPLDVQDGRWEVVEDGGERRLRPVPGSEGYDRIAMVTGAFGGGRRVEADIVFRRFRPGATWAGFGILGLWGGHLGAGEGRPRRGWRYGIAWFMRPYGPWCEFSSKEGDGARADVFAGRNVPDPSPDARLRLIAECRRRLDPSGAFLGWHLRMKLWPADEPEPEEWIECRDGGAARLPDAEYGVAVVAHECQAEFGPVRVLRAAPVVARR